MSRSRLPAVLLALALADAAVAAELVVTDFTDDLVTPAQGSLRERLATAQPGDTVRFGTGGLVALAGELRISTANLTIRGPGGFQPAFVNGGPATAPGAGIRVLASGVTFDDVEVRDVALNFQAAKSRTRLAGATVRGSRISGKASVGFWWCDSPKVENCAFSVDRGPGALEEEGYGVFALETGGLLVEGASGAVRGARFLQGVVVHGTVLRDDIVTGDVEITPGTTKKSRIPVGAEEPGTTLVLDCDFGTGDVGIVAARQTTQSGALTVRRTKCATLRIVGGKPTAEECTVTEGTPSSVAAGGERALFLRSALRVDNESRSGDVVVRNCRVTAGGKGIEVETDRRVALCTIDDNVVIGAADIGIHVISGAKSTQIRRNDVSGGDGFAGWMGILATGSQKAPVAVEECNVHDGPGIGIRVVQNEPGLVLRRNHVSNCRGFGIYAQAYADVEIEGGTVELTNQGGLAISDLQNVDGVGAGIGVGRLAQVSVRGVTIRSNAGPGVYNDLRSLSRISEVRCSGNAGAGIDIPPLGVTPNTMPLGGNLSLASPGDLEFDAEARRATGSTKPGAIVEVYAVEDGDRAGNEGYGEGAEFLGSVVAGADGKFTWPESGEAPCPPSGKLTFTATVSSRKSTVTSEFSEDLECGTGPPLELVSRSTGDVPGDGDCTTFPFLGQASAPMGHGSVASNGRVVFTSKAANLTADAHVANSTHVYLRDTQAGTTKLLTGTYDGGAYEPLFESAPMNARAGDTASISDDGKWVVFVARSSRILPVDFDSQPTVVLYSVESGAISAVTDSKLYVNPKLPSGAGAKGGGDWCSISGDGSAVAFVSIGRDWDHHLENSGDEDVFVWSRATDAVERVSTNDAGQEVANITLGIPSTPRLSHDGRFCVFASTQNLGPGGSASGVKLWLRDRGAGTTQVVSVDENGQTRTGNSGVISDDGRYVAFVSKDALVADDTNFIEDVYLRDRTEGTTVRLSRQPSGAQFPTADSHVWAPTMTGDARFLAFANIGVHTTAASEITRGPDTFLLDRTTGVVVELTGPSGALNGSAFGPALTRGGTTLVFCSNATNLAEAAANPDVDHVFLMPLDEDSFAPK